MNAAPALALFLTPALPAGLALAAGALLLRLEHRGRPLAALGPLAALVLLALVLARAPLAGPALAPLAAGLVVAALARDRANLLHSECALKLLWVMGGALALSHAGLSLLALATGVGPVGEQWGVLRLGLTPQPVWSAALPLALLAGLVMLGGAPFHFWVADLFQGARPSLAPLAVAALQAAGAAWIAWRLGGIAAFPEGATLARVVLATAAIAVFLASAGTLVSQRRPERRVGTLASLQAGLALSGLAAMLAPGAGAPAAAAWRLAPWAAHLALALTGAAALARFMPVPASPDAPGGALFRRHPASGLAGLFALFSLAGVPGTPGAQLWLDAARGLSAAGQTGALLALGAGWVAAFATVMQQVREAFGVASRTPPERAVPWEARAALWTAGVGLVALAVAWRVAGRP